MLGFGTAVPPTVMALLEQVDESPEAAATRAAFAIEGAAIHKVWRRKRIVARAVNKVQRTVANVLSRHGAGR